MNGMMTAIELMFEPQASDLGQPQSSCLGKKSTEDSPFLECLLGVFNAAEAMGGDGKPSGAGEALLLSSMSKTVAWKSHEDRPGSPQWEESVTEKPGRPGSPQWEESVTEKPGRPGSPQWEESVTEKSGRPGEKDRILEILGTLPQKGDATKKTEVIGEIVRESNEAGWDASKSISKAGRARLEGNRSAPSSQGAETAVAEIIGKQGELLPEILRIQSEPSLDKGQKSLLIRDASVGAPDAGKVATEEVLPKTFHDFVRRWYTSLGESQMGKDDGGFALSDPSAPEIGQRTGMRGFVPVNDEATASPTAQPLAHGEIGIVRNRPLSIFMADGFMQQIMENLNLRAWKVGQREVRIQLHPEELGRLNMEIGIRDHQVVLKIHVENPLVKDMIENSLAQLRDGLLDQGLRMGRCSVTVGDHFQHQLGRNGDNPSGSGDDPFGTDGGESEEMPSERFWSPYREDSDLVNLFI